MAKSTGSLLKDSVVCADGGRDKECSVCYQCTVHPVRLPCKHVFCYLCAKGIHLRMRHCALCRTAIPNNYLDNPEIIDHSELDLSTHEDKPIWFYQARSGGWWLYEKRCATEIEEKYLKDPEGAFDTLIAGWLYTIDLKNMVQYRKDNTSVRRAIKRDLIENREVRGLAGLKVNGRLPASGDGCDEEVSSTNKDSAAEDSNDTSAQPTPTPVHFMSILAHQEMTDPQTSDAQVTHLLNNLDLNTDDVNDEHPGSLV